MQSASPHNAYYAGGCYAGASWAGWLACNVKDSLLALSVQRPQQLATPAPVPIPHLQLPCSAAVNTAGERVDGFASDRVVSDRLLVYHYATKSLQVGC